MLTIAQAAREHLWQEAAEALASLLSISPRDSQIRLAEHVVEFATRALKVRPIREPSNVLDYHAGTPFQTGLVGVDHANAPPWMVHLLDARADLNQLLKTAIEQSDNQSAAKIALIAWECVMAIQVKIWVQNDSKDYRDWKADRYCKGVFESDPAQKAGEKAWNHVNDVASKLLGFSHDDSGIFQMRPAVSILRDLIGFDEGGLTLEPQYQPGV